MLGRGGSGKAFRLSHWLKFHDIRAWCGWLGRLSGSAIGSKFVMSDLLNVLFILKNIEKQQINPCNV